MQLLTRSIADELRRVLAPPHHAAAPELPAHTEAGVLVALYLDDLHAGVDDLHAGVDDLHAGVDYLRPGLDDLHVVLTRRREDLRHHPGEISFPGGRREEGEYDLCATALREAEEEIGLPAHAVEIVGTLAPATTVATGYVIHPFVGMIEPGRTWTLSANEVAEVIKVPVRELRCGYARRRLIRHGLHRPPRIPIRTDTYLAGERLIWGATARILTDLLQRLQPNRGASGGRPLPAPAGAESSQPFSIGTPTKLPHSVHEPS
ncbi:MAG: CoA pyrophosphatase [Actinomycetota bacterium]|nr:CoA pyrophosphatase [Actinomycetota bacterium]